MPRLGLCAILWALSVSFACLAQIDLQGAHVQGALLRGQLVQGADLRLNGEPVAVSKQGYFAIGFGRDASLEHQLTWRDNNGQNQQQVVTLQPREYTVQRIEGVASKYVSPPAEVSERIRQDNVLLGKARKIQTDNANFMQDFIWPAQGPISGVYGSQRVFNGEPKNPHYGLDVAAPVGTPVYAPAGGVVTLWVSDMYYSGGTMIIDHGLGVSSTFLHLSKSHVAEGDTVEQGQLVAEIGATGRVTGAHLDWRINWFSERLDPQLLVPTR
ncbi:MAG: M23 family metallopeptidase [Paraglaciecola sp.]|nr:M23 family metallopeptidase [Paraglaciecola sp.]NCT46493.1 M23 family metallopeptidase [Paraglaciecola sp.]